VPGVDRYYFYLITNNCNQFFKRTYSHGKA
jgi:hypothetical protein